MSAAGIDVTGIIFVEHFKEIYDRLNEGDVIYIRSFADFFSSISKLFSAIESVFSRKCSIVSLDEPWLDVSAGIMGKLCDLEHRMAVRRTKDGLAKAVAAAAYSDVRKVAARPKPPPNCGCALRCMKIRI